MLKTEFVIIKINTKNRDPAMCINTFFLHSKNLKSNYKDAKTYKSILIIKF